jgi:hypothetical protein
MPETPYPAPSRDTSNVTVRARCAGRDRVVNRESGAQILALVVVLDSGLRGGEDGSPGMAPPTRKKDRRVNPAKNFRVNAVLRQEGT